MSKSEGLQRVKLSESIPLSTPLVVQAHITSRCNFKCKFCAHALNHMEFEGLGIRNENMTMEIFCKLIDDLKEFPLKVKSINIAGVGEPLLHPEIVSMVKYAKEAGVAERIEIVTNASLLLPELSDRLIDAGLDRLRVSIEGMDDREYKDVCRAKEGTFSKIVSNLTYFYQHKKETSVYIKTMDIIAEKSYEKFQQIFAPIADYLAVENVAPLYEGVEYETMKEDFSKGMRGNDLQKIQVCPSPFYTLTLVSDGGVQPCCNYPVPIQLGNIVEKSLLQIWKDDKRKNFLKKFLQGEKNPICKKCYLGKYLAQPEDNLDEAASRLIEKF